MAPNSLSPASVVIDYHSAYAPHKMTIPTKEWFPTSVTGVLGSYQAWDLTTIDAEVMITALIDVIKPFLKANAAIDHATVYTQATPTSPNIPRAGKAFSVAGTSAVGNNEAAVSATWNFKTTGNGNAKIVILDTPFRSTWLAKVSPVDFTAAEIALATEFGIDSNAWSGRDDLRPVEVRNITWDVNDKLQREYFK